MNKKALTKLIILILLSSSILGLALPSRGAAINCADPHAYYQTPEGTIIWEKYNTYISECKKSDDISISKLLLDGFNEILSFIFRKIAFVMTWIMAWESALIGDMLGTRYFQFASSPLVHAGWYVSLQIANLILVLGLLIVADKIIIGAEKLGDYKKLVTYAVVALLINFSLVITGAIIGLSNAVTYYFMGLSGTPAEIAQRLEQISNVYSNMINDANNMLVGFVAGFIGVNILVLLILIFGAILYTTFTRIIKLWIAMIFAPLAIVLGYLNLGFGESTWPTWKKEFGKAITFPPIMAFFLWFTFMVMGKSKELFVAGSIDNDFWLSRLMEAFIFTAFLMFGYQQAVSMSGASLGALGDMISKTGSAWGVHERVGKKLKNLPNNIGKFIGKSGAYQELVAGAKKRFADSGIAQWARSRFAGVPGLSRIGSTFDKWGEQADKTRNARVSEIGTGLEYAINSIERAKGREAAIAHLNKLLRESADPAERMAALKILSTAYKRNLKQGLKELYGHKNPETGEYEETKEEAARKYAELRRWTKESKLYGTGFSVADFDAELTHAHVDRETDTDLFMDASQKFATDDFEKFRKTLYEEVEKGIGAEGMEDPERVSKWIKDKYSSGALTYGKKDLITALQGVNPLLIDDEEKRRAFIRSKSGDYWAGLLEPALLHHESILPNFSARQIQDVLEVAKYEEGATGIDPIALMRALSENPNTEGVRRTIGARAEAATLVRTIIAGASIAESEKQALRDNFNIPRKEEQRTATASVQSATNAQVEQELRRRRGQG